MRISNEGIDITKRFFRALEVAVECCRIRGVNTFCVAHDINRRNFLFVRDHPETSVVKPEWIAYLCKDLGISSDYILFGEGSVFADHDD